MVDDESLRDRVHRTWRKRDRYMEKELSKRDWRFDRKPYNNKYLMSVVHGFGERIQFFFFFLSYSLFVRGAYIREHNILSVCDVEPPIRKKVNINSFSRKSVIFERPDRK